MIRTHIGERVRSSPRSALQESPRKRRTDTIFIFIFHSVLHYFSKNSTIRNIIRFRKRLCLVHGHLFSTIQEWSTIHFHYSDIESTAIFHDSGFHVHVEIFHDSGHPFTVEHMISQILNTISSEFRSFHGKFSPRFRRHPESWKTGIVDLKIFVDFSTI